MNKNLTKWLYRFWDSYQQHDEGVLTKEAIQAYEQLKSLVEKKPKVDEKWIGQFTHDVFVFDPSEEYPLCDFLVDKLKEIGVEVEYA